MNKYFMFGDYSAEGMRGISSARTTQVREMIEKLGGKVLEIYVLLGEHDLVLIVELPNMADAMKAAVAVGRHTGIKFSTAAALSVEEFDRMVGDV